MSIDGSSWIPADIDLNQPNAARVYDYFIGGGCNFEIDRQFAKKILEGIPEVSQAARLNRGFLQRAVRFAAKQGIRQFLDLGAGIPSVGPSHEIARQAQQNVKVVYVDNEAVAVSHSRMLLDGDPELTVLQADLRQVETVLNAPVTRELLDFNEPIAVLMVAVLHFTTDDEVPWNIVSSYRDALPQGSHLILSHATSDGLTNSRVLDTAAMYRETSTPIFLRSREEIAAMFDGFEMADPGLVFLPEWQPDDPSDIGDHPEESHLLAGVGVKTS